MAGVKKSRCDISSLLFDFERNGNGTLDPEELSKVGATILGSAKDYKFFTDLEADGRIPMDGGFSPHNSRPDPQKHDPPPT